MASATKDLVTQNSVIEIMTPSDDQSCVVAIQYPVGGAGTLVLEGTLNGTDWVVKQIKDSALGTSVVSMTAAGIAYAEAHMFDRVRVRRTDAGGGSNLTTLSIRFL